VANQYYGRRTCETFDGVMLGQPKSPVSPGLRMLRKIDRPCDSVAGCLVRSHAYKVKD